MKVFLGARVINSVWCWQEKKAHVEKEFLNLGLWAYHSGCMNLKGEKYALVELKISLSIKNVDKKTTLAEPVTVTL